MEPQGTVHKYLPHIKCLYVMRITKTRTKFFLELMAVKMGDNKYYAGCVSWKQCYGINSKLRDLNKWVMKYIT